ncbi:MAG: dihydrolipoyl dehydrogenase [Eubacteriaceae bacterium]|nr:dihydrolipoyl dehydrogenase [Eubacteriaceae bacterium]
MKITIIGAGPGGYEAAIYAAKKGAEVVLVEKGEVGGTCLNRGCIPTKAMLASYEALEAVEEASSFGIELSGEISVNYEKIIARKDKIVAGLVKGIGMLCDKAGVKIIKGFGKVASANTVEVDKGNGDIESIESDYIILAMGSVPITPGMFKYDGIRVITSDEVLEMKEAPKSMVLVGGGVIGTEIGQFLSKMGTDLTIVEMMPQLLPTMDEDVGKQLARQFKKEKINTIVGDGIAEVNPAEDSVSVTLQSGKELTADYCLVAIGRMPFTAGSGIDEIGLEMEERGGKIKVDEYLRTSIPSIYAIGDLIDSPFLAHVASKEGLIAVDNIFGAQKKAVYHAVPAAVYTNPEIATVGYSEADLIKAEKPYKKGTFEFRGLGKAQTSGQIQGFVKVLTDEEGTLIGAAIVGAHASDMLQVLTTAVQLGLKADDVADSIFPHPSMSEAILEALHDLHGLSINKL